MPIDIHTFDCDTYIFDNKQLKKITLLIKRKSPISAWNLILHW